MSAPDRHGVAMEWFDDQPHHSAAYLQPTIERWLRDARAARVLDLGCGNGALTMRLAGAGFEMTGVDASASGIQFAAARAGGRVTFTQAWLEEPLPPELRGCFSAVLAAEVVEHLPRPGELCARAREALAPGGRFILTTPYHGYLKNLALAVTNGYDRHWHPLRDGGHIKFFSRATLAALLEANGFRVLRFARVGRVPPFAKSMIVEAERV